MQDWAVGGRRPAIRSGPASPIADPPIAKLSFMCVLGARTEHYRWKKEFPTMYTRRIAGFVFVVLLSITAAAGTVHAQRSPAAVKIFKSALFSYTLSYPATWHASKSPQLDILVTAPDNLATIGGKGVNGGVTVAALRQAVVGTISQLGVPSAKILRTTRVIHGVTFQVVQTTLLNVRGVKQTAIVLGASQHQRTYLFFGIVGLSKPSAHLKNSHAKEELAQVQAALSGITIAR
jgi:hypothetical protein